MNPGIVKDPQVLHTTSRTTNMHIFAEFPRKTDNGQRPPAMPFQMPDLPRCGLNCETLVTFDASYYYGCPMGGCLVVPIHSMVEELVAYAQFCLGNPQTPATIHSATPTFRPSTALFNLHRASRESFMDPLVIVEDLITAMKLNERGWRKVVALMGQNLSTEQEELLIRHIDWRSHVSLQLSEDNPNRHEIARRLGSYPFLYRAEQESVHRHFLPQPFSF